MVLVIVPWFEIPWVVSDSSIFAKMATYLWLGKKFFVTHINQFHFSSNYPNLVQLFVTADAE